MNENVSNLRKRKLQKTPPTFTDDTVHLSPNQPQPSVWILLVSAHLLPLAVDALGCDGSIGVCAAQLDPVALGDLLNLRLDGLDGLALLVGLGQGGLELLVGCDQTLTEGKHSTQHRWLYHVCV